METDRRKMKPGANRKLGNVPLYSLVSLGAFVCCLVVLLLLVFNGRSLTALGLTEHVSYFFLVLMGLAAAVFLFGVLPSSASFEGPLHGGSLKLSGPVVVGGLVVLGGHFFIPKAFTFPLTVYVHGPAGPQDVSLRNSGHVAIELGPEIERAPITESGEAHFPAIPSNFRGQEVPAWVESDTYESVHTRTKYRLDSSSLHLIVQKKIRSFHVAGIITDTTGDALASLRVVVPEYKTGELTDDNGRFDIDISADAQRAVTLVADKPGYQTQRFTATLGDSGVNFSLERRQ